MAIPSLIGKICVVRTYSAGAWIGKIASRKGKEIEMSNARRLWYWDGAASLSELAMSGVSKPDNCKFPVAVKTVLLTEAIEIIPATRAAIKSVSEVPVWSA